MSDRVPSLASRIGPVPGDAPIGSPVTSAPADDKEADAIQPESARSVDDQEVSALLESQYEVAVKLADMQGDPNSPLHSVKRFEDLGL
jgi:ATP-dependent RNA helicase DDX19/DBP5